MGAGQGQPSLMPIEWPYAPASIRVHPLSRMLPDGRVELRVECVDPEGDSVKSIGVLRVHVGDGPGAVHVEADLNDRGVQNLDWDVVLRDYKLIVRVPDGFTCSPGATLPVRVELVMTPTRELKAEGRIACP